MDPGTNNQGVSRSVADKVSIELWIMVMEQIDTQTPEETPFAISTPPTRYPFPASLRLVCRKWNDAATPFVYREVNMKCIFGIMKQDNYISRTASISKINNIVLHAKSFTLAINGTEVEHIQWGMLFQQLSACVKLQRIRYSFYGRDHEFPKLLTEYLAGRNPPLLLEVPGFVNSLKWIPSCLVPVLTTIQTSADYLQQAVECSDFILAAAKADSWDSCYVPFKLQLNGRFVSPMKGLRMIEHPWEAYTPDEFKAWDFSQLRDLRIVNAEGGLIAFMSQKTAKSLPRLSKISVAVISGEISALYNERLAAFIADFTTLTHIDLHHYDFTSLLPTIEKLGHQLFELSLHRKKQTNPPLRGHVMSPEVADKIQKSCVNLRVFCVDIPNSQKHQCALSITRMPKLKYCRLTVVRDSVSIMEPEKANEDCKDIARLLFGYTPTRNSLETVTIRHYITSPYPQLVSTGIPTPDHFATYEFDPSHFSAYLQTRSNGALFDLEDDKTFISGEY
ncbi:hypothetical protein GLAREA_03519 [Glarea lozoyensis ATCC 20868]|uniref:Uncharacterized protein n=1 Tax=Glarea lozoyensis (strain ATCC 20868 / MF5171) TaxID=1116229 RepID=S3CVW1_GLAL2|nr:uncharacterized protein GLAREA_03519 [Glarea lozoyensis ATCC 20868]EPE30552.1 hypothetical protein GLAREA_03519 [Glarea lozoyensis ATCC 20868]